MKPLQLVTSLSLLLAGFCAHGQGTFIYDQQSADESLVREGGADIQQNQPIGQSFTPALSAVGFIRIYVYNGLLGDTSAATMAVNLRAGSITGTILSSSDPVPIPSGINFARPVDFFFPSAVSVSPGTSYFFQPAVIDNNNLGLNQSSYNYAGGTAFFQGLPNSMNNDLWFREGILVVPEPSSALLVVAGVGVFLLVRQVRQRREQVSVLTIDSFSTHL